MSKPARSSLIQRLNAIGQLHHFQRRRTQGAVSDLDVGRVAAAVELHAPWRTSGLKGEAVQVLLRHDETQVTRDSSQDSVPLVPLRLSLFFICRPRHSAGMDGPRRRLTS